MRKNNEKADGYFLKAVALHDDNPHAHFLYSCSRGGAQSRAVEKNFLRALSQLELERSPARWIAYLAYGDYCEFVLNDPCKARLSFRRASSFRLSVLPLIAYSHSLVAGKNVPESIGKQLSWCLSTANAMQPTHDVSSVYVSITYVYLELKLLCEAEDVLRILLSKGVHLDYAYRCLAQIHLRRGELLKADSAMALARSFPLASSNPFLFRSCAALHAFNGSYLEAYNCINQALSLDALEPHSWEMCGILSYILHSDSSKFLTCVENSLKILSDLNTLRMKGQILFELQRYEESREVFENILSHDPEDSLTRISLIVCLEAIHYQVCKHY